MGTIEMIQHGIGGEPATLGNLIALLKKLEEQVGSKAIVYVNYGSVSLDITNVTAAKNVSLAGDGLFNVEAHVTITGGYF